MTALQAPPEPSLGSWIRDIRLEAGFTQKQLAAKMAPLKVTQNDVSRWERGLYVPNVFEMRRLAEVTGAEYLLDLRVLPSRCTDELPLAA